MVLAGSSPQACRTCGAPWVRQTEKSALGKDRSGNGGLGADQNREPQGLDAVGRNDWKEGVTVTTTGWAPSCDHGSPPVRCVVLDPFSGSGTTGMVALQNGRDYIGIDLNEGYLPLAEARILGERPPVGDSEPDLVAEMFA